MVQLCKPYGFSKESNVTLPALLEILPDDLKLFRWDGFPKKSLPLDFNPKNHSHLYQLREGDQVFQALCNVPFCFTDRKSVNLSRLGLNAKN